MSFNPENYPAFRVTAEFTDDKGFKWMMGGMYVAAPNKEAAAKYVSNLIKPKQFGHPISISFRQCDEYEVKWLKQRANGIDPSEKKNVWQRLKNTFGRDKHAISVSR